MRDWTYQTDLFVYSHVNAALFAEDHLDARFVVVHNTDADTDASSAIHTIWRLDVAFDDVERDEDGRDLGGGRIAHAITPEQAAAVARFAAAVSEGAPLCVTCPGGVSRSAGVAAALLVERPYQAQRLYREKCPNATVKGAVIAALRGLENGDGR